MTIIGWIYDADYHCNLCTPEDLKEDSEGNLVHPIFSTDELEDDEPICADCGDPLE